MTLKEVRKLHNGDEVFWNDPDDGLTSRHITIQSIKVLAPDDDKDYGDEIVCIHGKNGDELECFAHELS
ncbi:MAG: hypothetical protein DRP09_21040 [Candidatus Thorarchaeota archaeon]|nr:MAG: hypothetical protein DRP09_21040 [Candidatus Thorarchaeota archaeon]